MTSVHVEWGPTGATASIRPGGIAVVVDVLSFTTTLTVAVERGMTVYPFRWADVRATTYARTRDAVLAVGRRAAHPGEVSLSPSTVLAATGVRRLVLPSPNGSSICFGLADAGVQVVGASLRNRTAVARWLLARSAGHDDDSPVVVVAAGERWPDDTLRPAVEDLWGAGAVVAALADLGSVDLSVEARMAEQAFRAVADRLPGELPACTSGRELVDGGFPDDVELAAQLDASGVVPVLADGAFTAAE